MDPSSQLRLQESLAEIHRLLAKHRLLETVARRQETPKSALLEQMQHRQNLVELHKRLKRLHPADVAHILESLPLDDRSVVWRELTSSAAAQALVEVSAGIRESLVENTPQADLVRMLRELDADDLRYLSESLPDEIVQEIAALLDARDRTWVEESRAYGE
jgi:magnesium transporter